MQPYARSRYANHEYHRAALACLVLSFVMTTGAATSARSPAGITSITYGDIVYEPTQTVKVWRGLEAKLRVVGVPIGTSIDVVALLPDGQTPAPLIKVSRGNVDPTTAFVTLDAAPIAQLGEYLVRFVYPVAAGTPDQFRIRLYDRGTVSGIVVTPEWQKVAEDLTVTATGQGLEHAKLDVSMSSLALTNYRVVSRSATQLVFTVRPGKPGDGSISSHMFFDENVGATQAGLPASYLGNVNAWLNVSPNPIITGVTPLVVADGGEVTLKGSNFVADGYTASVRDAMMSGTWSVPATVVNATTLRFNAKPNMTAQDLVLRYTPASGSGGAGVAIPQTIWVNTTPVITDAGTALWGTAPPACNAPPCSTSGDTRVFGVRTGETHTIGGFYLATAPGTTVTARLGNTPLNIVSVLSNHIRFTVPDLADLVGGHIFVETSGGTGTSPRAAYYNPAPSNLGLLRKDGQETSSTAPWVPVTDGKLERNRNYRISGNNLEFMVDGFPATDPAVRPKLMRGSAEFRPLSFIAGNISFFVPTDQPLGSYTLSYGHWGGTAPLGTFQVVENKPLAVVSRLAVTSSSTVWYDNGSVQGTTTSRTIQSGTSRTVSIAVREFSHNGELQPLLVTSTDPAIVPGTPSVWTPASLSSGENGALNVAPYPNPTASVSLQVQAVPEDRNAVLRFSVGPAPNSNGIAEVPVVIRAVQPPATRQLTVDQTAVHGGQPLKGTLLLEFTPVFPVTVPLASSDPVAAQVPASVTMFGSSIIVPVTTSNVPKVTSVTITAGTGRTAQSATFAVHPAPVLQSFTAATTPFRVGQPVNLTISLAAPATRATEVRFTSSNPVVLSVPIAVTFAEGQQTAIVRVVPGFVVAETSVSVTARVGESLRVLQVRVMP